MIWVHQIDHSHHKASHFGSHLELQQNLLMDEMAKEPQILKGLSNSAKLSFIKDCLQKKEQITILLFDS